MEYLGFLQKNKIRRNIIFAIFFLAIIFVATIFFNGLKLSSQYFAENLVGSKVPKFSTSILEDSNVYFTEKDIKKNKYSLINIWASWCASCRKEHKFLLKLTKIEGLDIYGINFKDKKNNAISFLDKYGNPYIFSGVDHDGSLSINLGSYGVPESILIDKNKNIIAQYVGPLNKKRYLEIINNIRSN